MAHTVETMLSALNLFEPCPVQTSVLGGNWLHFKPLQAISESGPISFFVPGNGSSYVDMNKTMLYLKMKVLKEDGSVLLPTDPDYTVVNNTMSTLFNEVKFELANQQVSNSNMMYHYQAYIQNLFNFSHLAKDSHLSSVLWYEDSANQLLDLRYGGNRARRKLVEKSAEVEMMGKLHCNLLSIDKYLPNEVNMKLQFYRNPAALVCLSDDPTVKLKIEILDMTLMVRKVDINPGILLAHAKLLETTTMKLGYRRVEMQNYTLPSGIMQKSLDNLFLSRLPSRLVFGLVMNSSFCGKIDENPFDFQHFDLNHVSLTVNGRAVNSAPYKIDFGKKLHVVPYVFSHIGVGCHLLDDGFCLSRDSFAGGFALFTYDFSHDLCGDNHFSPAESANVRLELGWSKALPCVVNLVMYSEHFDLAEICRNREVSLHYKA
jgi:hypothetical protein